MGVLSASTRLPINANNFRGGLGSLDSCQQLQTVLVKALAVELLGSNCAQHGTSNTLSAQLRHSTPTLVSSSKPRINAAERSVSSRLPEITLHGDTPNGCTQLVEVITSTFLDHSLCQIVHEWPHLQLGWAGSIRVLVATAERGRLSIPGSVIVRLKDQFCHNIH